MHDISRHARILLVACALVGCKDEKQQGTTDQAKADKQERAPGEPADEGAEQPADEGAGSDPELATAMAEHFVHAAALEQAVIDGDLEAVATQAKWIVDELPKDKLPEPWQPHLERMQSVAKRAAAAEDLAAAGVAAGELVGTCGACHRSTGKGPKFGELSPVPEGEDTKTRMARHQWAASRMREGMVGPSDDRWTAGASAVSEAPPKPCPIPDDYVLPKETLDLREKIYEIGAKALETTSPEERAAVYGEYLTTCAGCHVGGC